MRWNFRVVTPPTADTSPCLSVFFETQPSAKYIFGCGESTFRTVVQRKVGIGRVQALFLSGIDEHRSAGLPSLLMGIADSGHKEFTVTGPEGLHHFLASTRTYAMREQLALKAIECASAARDDTSCKVYEDQNVSVFGISVNPISSSVTKSPAVRQNSPGSLKRRASAEPEELLTAEAHRLKIVNQSFRGIPPAGINPPSVDWRLHRKHLPPAPRATSAVSYTVVGPVVRGKFDVNKAKQYGIVGPARGRLTKGESVLAADGVTLVTPDMCIGPSTPPSALIIVDCPSHAYIDNLTSSPQFDMKRHHPDVRLALVFHQVGEGVLEDSRYTTWMQSFGPDVQHLVSHQSYTPNAVTYTNTAHAQLLLGELDPEIFPLLKHISAPQRTLENYPDLPPNTSVAQIDHEVGLNPPVPLKSEIPAGLVDRFHPAIDLKKSGQPIVSDDLIQKFEEVRGSIKELETTRIAEPGDDVVITPLGTGSAAPSKTRNVLSNLVHVPGWGNILLDAGEGAWGQLARRFGTSSTDGTDVYSILRDLKCIFISHIHADHHMGLSKILAIRRELNPPPKDALYLIATTTTIEYLREYNDLRDVGLGADTPGTYAIRLISNDDIVFGRKSQQIIPRQVNSIKARTELEELMGFTSVETVSVKHRGPCFGIVLRHRDGWSLAFSGDTMPCDALVEAGKNVTLLIHEATLADDEVEMAAGKQHSTTGQAIDIGTRMGAKNLLLTHFSQRYPKMPDLNAKPTLEALSIEESAQASTEGAESSSASSVAKQSLLETTAFTRPTIALAFDFASIPIGSMWKMEKYTPVLEQLFAQAEEVDEEETALMQAMMGGEASSLTTNTAPVIEEKVKEKKEGGAGKANKRRKKA